MQIFVYLRLSCGSGNGGGGGVHMCMCVCDSLEMTITEPWQQKKPSSKQVYRSNKPAFMVA